jgi:hypothetical protein
MFRYHLKVELTVKNDKMLLLLMGSIYLCVSISTKSQRHGFYYCFLITCFKRQYKFSSLEANLSFNLIRIPCYKSDGQVKIIGHRFDDLNILTIIF